VLLAVALLFTRSLGNAKVIDTGYDASQLVSVDVNLRLGHYDAVTGTQAFERAVDAIRRLPMVTGAALAATIPLAGSRIEQPYYREGDAPRAADARRPTADVNIVGPAYFATTGIALARGREFEPNDRRGAAPVAIVNRTMAKLLWPGEEAIGKRVSLEGQTGPWMEVVGVARDIKYNTLGESPTPVLYVPHAQSYRDHMLLQVRLAPTASLNAARTALVDVVGGLDPNLPPAPIQAVESAQQLSLLPSRIGAGVLGGFGLLALVLAAVGIFGVSAFAVAQRRREIGIRMALGARGRAVITTVLGDTMRTVSIGGAVGIAAALGAAKLLRSQLYGLGTIDGPTFLLVPVVLAGVAVLSAAIPARRAVQVDPVVALRAE
jgi:predicted permease